MIFVKVYTFDFLEQAMDLINDHHIWSDMNNFVGMVDAANPFSGCSPSPIGHLDEVVDGSWYRSSFAECQRHANGEDFLMLGVIAYCDKTGTDVNMHAGLEPFTFTFTIFNRHCWYKTEAWHLLGYMPNIDMKSSASKKQKRGTMLGKGMSTHNYHKCLSYILKSFIENQGWDAPIYADIRIGNLVSQRCLFFPWHI